MEALTPAPWIMARRFLQIAVMIDPSVAWGRGLLRGIISFARQKNNTWQFSSESSDPPLGRSLPANWHGDGVICKINTLELHQAIKAQGVPAVNVAMPAPGLHLTLPSVLSDYERVGRMAADHLLDCGLQHFAYWSATALPHRHYNGFYLRLRAAGYEPHVLSINAEPWDVQEHLMERWLAQLPTPVGVFAINDAMGRSIVQACLRCDLRVPEDVAVLGVTNDELLCEMCHPPLSSVALATERQGFVAAQLLDRLMAGDAPPAHEVLIEPQGVVARQSTNVLMVPDPEVSAAIQFIRRHATEPIQVEDVLRAVPASRRSLEARFKRILGRGPAAEIRRVQIEKAKELLALSDLQMPAIAKAAGFHTPEYMACVFRRTVGTTPRDYRASLRRC